MASGRACIAAKGWPAISTARSPCRSKSMPTTSRRNAATGSWPCTCRAPSAKNRRRSRSADIAGPHACTEADIARSQALEVQEKKELVSKEEKTVPARYYVTSTEIYETEDGFTEAMDSP